jgi:hypothetical protein
MKLTELYTTLDGEYLKLFAKVYSSNSSSEYCVHLEIDDEINKIVSFSCTCKYCTIQVGEKNCVDKRCKHINFVKDCLNKVGWEIQDEK